MPLNQIILLRINGALKKELEDIALKAGITPSALARNTIAIALSPPRKPNVMEEIMQKIKHENDFELYNRSGKNDGEKENGQ